MTEAARVPHRRIVAWLIECGQTWLVCEPEGGHHWTQTSYDATRFPSKRAAEHRAEKVLHGKPHRWHATEHVWL